MVVLAASIVSKSGKVLVSRQFIDMSRIRIEGLLAAFPKLVGAGKQHTYVKTENVRYVYQPIEALYLLLVTNKQATFLKIWKPLGFSPSLYPSWWISKIIFIYSFSLDKEGIGKTAFELITFDEVKQYCEMESHKEKLHKLVRQSKINETKDVMKRKASEIDKKQGSLGMGSGRLESSFSEMSISSGGSGFGSGSGFGLSTDADSFSAKPKGYAPSKGLGMQLGKTQRTNQFLESLKAEGEVILEDVQPKAAASKLAAEKINVTLKRDGGMSNFDLQGTLSLQILNREDGLTQVQILSPSIKTRGNPGSLFKAHPNINEELFNSESILSLEDPNRPFPTGQAGDAAGSSSMFDLRNVVISIPLPALREAPNVRQIDGEWRRSTFVIDNSNLSGSMEFVVPPAYSSAFFPISVQFSATSTFSDLRVVNSLPLRGGPPPKFSQRTHLTPENYQVV
ncbi:hypothetical protein ACJRO7_022251 [Eucalyptus globulus]|uniref:Coatomer subunit delta n=1 Tax=Eucalyptus globulus TaxID=34317 RepID=A0ABD3KML0_EUCGL